MVSEMNRIYGHTWRWPVIVGLAAGLGMVAGLGSGSDAVPPQVKVEVEEEVYRYVPADNGAGPLWCWGSTCLVRWKDCVFASGLETLPGVPPRNNCRWMFFAREDAGSWRHVLSDPEGRTREPCPLVVLQDGRIVLSGNPTLAPLPAPAGPARPELWIFQAQNPDEPPVRLLPQWSGEPAFSEHSYRSFAADGVKGEWILFQNIGYTHAEWTFCDRDGKFSTGRLVWPFGHEYPEPQPIRICYPSVALVNRAVYFCGVSDIPEPYPEWRAYKRQLTGRVWDFDFRRLFFTWCKDITTGQFEPWIELSSRDRTCGWITPCDLWVRSPEEVHVLWTERAIDERLRPKFFPDEKQSYELCWGIVSGGRLERRIPLLRSEEGDSSAMALRPGMARFHLTPDGRVFVIFYVHGRDAEGKPVSENRLLELNPAGEFSEPVVVPFQASFEWFFTSTPRGGSLPDWRLDLLGSSPLHTNAIRYARLRILPR
jgi:hypothetical protein